MNKTKKIIIQACITLLTAATIFYVFFGFSDWLSYYDFNLYLTDDITFINVLFGLMIVWIVCPILFSIAFLKRNTKTPKLDKIIKVVLYIAAVNMLVAWLYHIEYLFLSFDGSEQDILPQGYYMDMDFWVNFATASLFYIIPAVLYDMTAMIGGEKNK